MRVLVAMSGGVDSSVAAARMVDAGHDVGEVGRVNRLHTAGRARAHGGGQAGSERSHARILCPDLGY